MILRSIFLCAALSPIPAALSQTPDPSFPAQEASAQSFVVTGDAKASAILVTARASRGRGATSVSLRGTQPPEVAQILAKAAARVAEDRKAQWIPSQIVTVELGAKLNPLDVAGAGLGMALALDGLVSGQLSDPAAAASGVLGDSEQVQPVSSFGRKIREAAGAVRILIVPAANREDMTDLLVTDGVGPWLGVQVFQVSTWPEARRLVAAPEHRDALINEAMRLFDEVRAALGAKPSAEKILQESVRLRLLKILELEPGHLSARMILAVAEKRVPARLSLLGSLRLLNRAEQVLTLKDPTSLFQAAAAINRQRPLLAPEVQVVWDALAARLEAKRRLLSGGTVMGDGQAKAKQAEQSYEIAVQTLNLIPEVQEAREKLAREP